MTAPLLAVRGVKTFYGNIMALKGIDLEVNEGEIVTLIGANGAGKSTLMMTIFGDPRLSEGRIVFDGRDRRGPGAFRPGSQAGLRFISAAAEAHEATRRHAVRRRAADARDCAGA